MPTYREVNRTVTELRELADFLERKGVELPDFWLSTTLNVPLTSSEYTRDADGEYSTKINEVQTKQNVKKFLKAIGKCEKDYRDDRIRITKKFKHGERAMIVGTADRSIACKKVVTGKKFVKEQLIPSKWEEEVEWKCDEGLSLKKLVADV